MHDFAPDPFSISLYVLYMRKLSPILISVALSWNGLMLKRQPLSEYHTSSNHDKIADNSCDIFK
jgi:hypothetical protein